MKYVALVESLGATEIFLGQALIVVCHWKQTIVNANEKIKAVKIQLKNMKIEVEKTKTLEMALSSSNKLVTKLQRDLDKHVSSLSAKSKKNDTQCI